ncbi:MAG TPA: nucleotidyltransferase domain-containing protein, partial [Myxococcota bacterium]
MKRQLDQRFDLGLDDTVLPKGTRVIVRVPVVDEAGEKHRAGFLAVVRSVDNRSYSVETPAGSTFVLDRAQLDLERADLLQSLADRQWDERRLRDNIIYAAVVGSKAWGLDDENSDEDVRGCFVLPFEEHASIYDAPDEIHEIESGTSDAGAYWEIEKLVRQALRADPNTLEMLWSPLMKRATPLGQKLVDARAIFSSQRVVLSFGRYAQTQLDKLGRAGDRARNTRALLDAVESNRVVDERAATTLLRSVAVSSSPQSQAQVQALDDVHAIVRSLFDRGLVKAASFAALVDAVRELGAARLAPEEVRPKNAYNLVRLLASCAHWLEHAEPLMRVPEPLKSELLAIKHGVTPLHVTLARARDLARAVDERAALPTPLPAE